MIGKEQLKKTVEIWAREVGIEGDQIMKIEVDGSIVSYFKLFAENLERTLTHEMPYCPLMHAAYLKHLKELMIKLCNSLMISSIDQLRLSGADS